MRNKTIKDLNVEILRSKNGLIIDQREITFNKLIEYTGIIIKINNNKQVH